MSKIVWGMVEWLWQGKAGLFQCHIDRPGFEPGTPQRLAPWATARLEMQFVQHSQRV